MHAFLLVSLFQMLQNNVLSAMDTYTHARACTHTHSCTHFFVFIFPFFPFFLGGEEEMGLNV